MVTRDLERISYKTPPYKNMKPHEMQTIRNLYCDKNITIRPADKGGALVIMNTSDYDAECNRQLQDSTVYAPLDHDPTASIKQNLETILDRAMELDWINEHTRKFLNNKHPRIPNFYTLPKIHKDQAKPPGRPIVAGMDSINQPLGIYIDFFLQPLIQNTSTYIRDTTHFLQKLNSSIFHCDHLMFTIDVKSLYTSIPHDLGIESVEWLLLETPEVRAQKEFIIVLLQFIAENSYFQYQNKFFLQTSGTSMGATMAPSYANCFMYKFETEHILKNQEWNSNIHLWSRYIDDIFGIWTGTESTFTDFFEYLNSIDPRIQFTSEISKDMITFLDVLIKKGNSSYSTTLFRKTTDRNNLLHRLSFHQPSLLRNLPYSQLLRVKKIVSDPEECLAQQIEMKDTFLARGFKQAEVLLASEKVNALSRETLLTNITKSKRELKSPVYVSKYSIQSNKIKNSIKKHWSIFKDDVRVQKLFDQTPVFAYQRSRNLRDELVHTRPPLKEPSTQRTGTYPCLHCANCNMVIKGNVVNHPRTGNKIPLKSFGTCDSVNIIYGIKCPCGKYYVGQSTRAAKIRWNEHRSCIRNSNPNSAVARHWSDKRHGLAQIRFLILEVLTKINPHEDMSLRLNQRETFWIDKLGSLQPNGLNDEINYHCYL
ncbi:uncharacterized protein [Ambystoma mexicanum]|uniref:uncharacterized protein n=1 Tax=Ambystoma mexicanum TaxID=8296 RepID=UPI0037E83AE6